MPFENAAILRDITVATKDGEWGKGEPGAGLVEMRVIRGTDFDDAQHTVITSIPTRHIPEQIANRKRLEPGDILIETAGGSRARSTGRTMLVKPRLLQVAGMPITCASFARFIRIDKEMADPAFVYWFFQSMYHQGLMEQHQVQHTGIARFQFTRFAETVRVPLPPLPEQRRIAAVLGALDDKIGLNRRMNRTLEQMAQAIFRSWFVDFDGHTEFEDSGTEMGEVPKGWVVKPLDKVAHFLNGAACQKYPPQANEKGLPVIKIRELRSGFSESSDRASRSVPQRYIIRDGDVLFSWSGSLLVRIWSGGQGLLNQHLFKVTSEQYPKWFYHLWVQHYLSEFQRIAESKATTMGHIKRHHLADALVVVPPESRLQEMGRVLEPLLNRQLANEIASRTLAELRDTLLPKLISGEIRVGEAEELVQENG